MDLRSISANQVTIWVVLALGLVVALLIGSAVGNSDVRLIGGVLAVIPVAIIFIKLKTNIWLLLPIGYTFSGSLKWLPLPFSVRDLCFLAVILSFVLFIATRAIPWKRKLGTLDYLIFINLAYLAVVYVRNPVGVWAMQSGMVGGRPYFEVALSFCAFLILSRVHISDFTAKIFPLFSVVPLWTIAALDTVGRVVPQLGYVFNSFYSGVGPGGGLPTDEEAAMIGTTRITGLQSAGTTTVLTLCAKYNPVTLLSPLYPARVILLVIALGAIFLSGFRSAFLFSLAMFVFSLILRRNQQDLLIACAAGIATLLLIITIQGSVVQLPLTMQRALSWLPGDWDSEAVEDANASTLWRVEMWVWAWNDERVLRDKVWGQGFGFSIEDMNLIATALSSGMSTSGLLGGSDREQYMITGALHSGPLSSIKYVGIIGFVLFYALMCYMAVSAWRLCKSTYGTKAFSLALFVGLPLVYSPFTFAFVFGALEATYVDTLYSAGLLSMTQRYAESLMPRVDG